MDKITWCLQQKKGIELIEPSDNLRSAYLIKAEEALQTLQTTKSRDWQLTTAYYTVYHALYSLLMKIGIKCEIHSCTIECSKRFLKYYFSDGDFYFIDKAFSARIDSQYYVNKNVPDANYELILKTTPLFLVKCKNVIITQQEINEIREKIKQYLRSNKP